MESISNSFGWETIGAPRGAVSNEDTAKIKREFGTYPIDGARMLEEANKLEAAHT
jgi:hypothetical protein